MTHPGEARLESSRLVRRVPLNEKIGETNRTRGGGSNRRTMLSPCRIMIKRPSFGGMADANKEDVEEPGTVVGPLNSNTADVSFFPTDARRCRFKDPPTRAMSTLSC